jgi:uncharacterized membrane protein
MSRYFQIFFILCISFYISFELSSCKDTQEPTPEIVFPDSIISYSKHVGPLFQQRCTYGCHSSDTPTGYNPSGLNLQYPESYHALMIARTDLIDPYNDSLSVLAWHLDGRYLLMPPPNRTQLTNNQKIGVKKWINEGALNN